MKLQGSRHSNSKILQSQITQSPKNKLTFKPLAVVHRRLNSALLGPYLRRCRGLRRQRKHYGLLTFPQAGQQYKLPVRNPRAS